MLILGSLIKFKCYNVDGATFGAGCFSINNKCRCYMFNTNDGTINYNGGHNHFKVNFNDLQCEFDVYWLNNAVDKKDYYYYHYIPLDVDEIKCKNIVKTVPSNMKYLIRFSDFIDASFNVTNLKISINENYNYFTLNNNKLESNTKFNISSDLTFFHDKNMKIKIKFKNYGIVINNDKICEIKIRVCYESCLNCYDIDANYINHQCSNCKNGYYFIQNTTNCMTKEEMKESNYYFDEEEKIFKKCYNNCLTCNNIDDINDMKCNTCDNEKYFFAEPNNCIEDNINYYYSEEEKKYMKCKTCYECFKNSNESNHNCKNCINDEYHFIYNQKGKCINSEEKH